MNSDYKPDHLTVEDLIRYLSKLPPDLEVVVDGMLYLTAPVFQHVRGTGCPDALLIGSPSIEELEARVGL